MERTQICAVGKLQGEGPEMLPPASRDPAPSACGSARIWSGAPEGPGALALCTALDSPSTFLPTSLPSGSQT